MITIQGATVDYYLTRAMVAGSLDINEMDAIQEKEKTIGRCLMGFEIFDNLNKGSIREFYGIPQDDEAQRQHNYRIGTKLHELGLIDHSTKHRINPTNIEETHSFDSRIFLNKEQIDFYYQGASSRASKYKDKLKSDE
jgi:hypothetical protein